MDTKTILQKPALYVIATPIGNLKDITVRAIETLQLCDLILAEDTRKAKILFQKFDIHTPLKSFRNHQMQKDIQFTIKELNQNKSIGFITDAGTPGISDPISHLIRILRKETQIPVIPIPGPSALTTILSISGWKINPTLFLGFLSPKKGKRYDTLKQYQNFEGCIVIYESVHRIEKLLEDISDIFPERDILIGREMTKQFEEYVMIKANMIPDYKNQITKKGEFTIMIAPIIK